MPAGTATQGELFRQSSGPGGVQFSSIPSGPPSDPPSQPTGTRECYLAWRATEEGGRAWGAIRAYAAELMAQQPRRVSTKHIVETIRLRLHVKINNSWTCFIADDLIAWQPAFRDVIDRRVRRVQGLHST